jgi:hypothetical protein
MNDVPEDEALALLENPLICEDPGDWVTQKLLTDHASITCGLINKDGLRTGLVLDFQFLIRQKTGLIRYIFTIFKTTKQGKFRVYQLDIQKFKLAPKNKHDLPHEHVGNRRISGKPDWLSWSYDEVLQHFCAKTRVEFDPSPPDDPEVFRLRG